MSSIETISPINPVNSQDWQSREATVVVRCGCHGAGRATWLELADRVLQSWQMTMRLAILVLMIAGMAVLTVTLGLVR
jgi:hypothetical protein